MRKVPIAVVTALVLIVSAASAAFGVTNGGPDGNAHPYIGLIVFDDAPGHPAWRCSGALLTPTVVLTAGHCTDGAVAARAWFDKVVQGNPEYPFSGATSYDGTPNTFPEYTSPGHGLVGFSWGDVGVVVLSEPVPTSAVSTYADLPSANLVDTLPTGTGLDFVGYGVQFKLQVSGPPSGRWAGPKVRMATFGELLSGQFRTSADQIKVTMNAGGGSGGTCFGDSGGPDLLGGTATVLAVNSYVTNYNCAGVGYDTRVDRPERLAWIEGFED